jgi:hypothetical protein
VDLEAIFEKGFAEMVTYKAGTAGYNYSIYIFQYYKLLPILSLGNHVK